jgi:hypothetical protein
VWSRLSVQPAPLFGQQSECITDPSAVRQPSRLHAPACAPLPPSAARQPPARLRLPPRRRTRRWEAHIWENKKQLYLGGFAEELDAAKAHDVMSVWTRGWEAQMNLRPSYYKRLGPYVGAVPKVGIIQQAPVSRGGAGEGSFADQGPACRAAVQAQHGARAWLLLAPAV